jgi:hypothetical protein
MVTFFEWLIYISVGGVLLLLAGAQFIIRFFVNK